MMKTAELQQLIRNNQIDQAIDIIHDTYDFHDEHEHYIVRTLVCALFVHTVLNEEKSTPKLINIALQAFFETRKKRQNDGISHGYWVSNLCRFTDLLWPRRDNEWTKRLYKAAIRGSRRFKDPQFSKKVLCRKLIITFFRYATCDDNLNDYGLTFENLVWLQSRARVSKNSKQSGSKRKLR